MKIIKTLMLNALFAICSYLEGAISLDTSKMFTKLQTLDSLM